MKAHQSKIIVAAFIACALVFASQANAGVIAHYSFNGTLTTDNSGNGHTLSSPTTPLTTTTGAFGQAAVYNGVSGQSLWRDTSDPSFDFDDNDFAISLWYRRGSTGSEMTLIGKGNPSSFGVGDTDSGFALRVSAGTSPTLDLIEGAGSSSDSVASATITGNDVTNFQHVLFQREGGVYSLYVNNSLEDISSFSGNSLNVASLAFAIGAESVPIGNTGAQGNNFFDGAIDEVWVFDSALDLGQIEDLFLSNTFSGPGPGGSGPAIPEPTSVALVGLGLLFLARRNRRR